MSTATERTGNKAGRPAPRRKVAQISPELAEVLRMLKALEDQPADPPESDDAC
jgi:hypothetical protein